MTRKIRICQQPSETTLPAPGLPLPGSEMTVPAPGLTVPTPGPILPAPEMTLRTPGQILPAPEMTLPAPEPILPAPEMTLPAPGPILPDSEMIWSTPGPALSDNWTDLEFLQKYIFNNRKINLRIRKGRNNRPMTEQPSETTLPAPVLTFPAPEPPIIPAPKMTLPAPGPSTKPPSPPPLVHKWTHGPPIESAYPPAIIDRNRK